MANETPAYQVILDIKETEGVEPEDRIQTIARLIITRLRKTGKCPKAIVTCYKKESRLVAVDIPKEELESCLNDMAQKGTIRGYTFTYQLSTTEVTKEQVEEHEIENLEAKIAKKDEQAQLLERRLKESSLENEALSGKYKLLEETAKDLRKSLDNLDSQTKEVREQKVNLIPELSKAHMFELIGPYSSLVVILDGYIDTVSRFGCDIKNKKIDDFMEKDEFMRRKFGVKTNDLVEIFSEYLRREAKRPAEALKEIFDAMIEYDAYKGLNRILTLFNSANPCIPFFVAHDGEASHYYIPRGSNWGELSKSLRDNTKKIAEDSGVECSVSKIESAYILTIDSAKNSEINRKIENYDCTLWKNMGIRVKVIDLKLARED